MAPKQNAKIVNLADNNDVAKEFQSAAAAAYDRNFNLQEQFSDIWKVADGMNKCMQNRTLADQEKSQGMDDPKDNRANLGSTIFNRLVGQMASQLVAVELSRPVPFKYEPIFCEGVYNSMEEGRAEAEQMNNLARYTMKHDKYKKKATDFAYSLAKYGNVPIAMEWKFDVKTVKIPVPQYSVDIDPNTGEEIAVQTETSLEEREVVVAAYPSQRQLNIGDLVADPYIGNIQDQTTVVVKSICHKSDILDGVNKGIYSKKVYESLDENDLWDGDAGTEFRKELLENKQMTWDESSVSDLYMKWDIYHRSPINGKSWDANKNVPVWYFGTIIGNAPSSGKLITLIRNPDPDDEIPIEMVNLYPDDSDLLYHVSPAEIIRSNYSTACSLMELAVDNMAKVNKPNLKVVPGRHRVKDFSMASGAVWEVFDKDAITHDDVRDNTQSTLGLLEYIKQDIRVGMGVDKNMSGESYGARTTLGEAQNINQQTQQPSLVWISYVLDQKLGFWAKKNKSFWRAFGNPEIIQQITDMPLLPNVNPTEFKGDFNIEINIVGEYQDDMKKASALNEIIRMVAQSPQLLQSDTHQIDIGGLMKDVLFNGGINADKYILTPQNGDAVRIAEMENIAMMQNGQQVEVLPTDNDVVHIRVHKGERLKYYGIEDQYPNTQYVDAHIAQHELKKQNSGQQALNDQQAVIGGIAR